MCRLIALSQRAKQRILCKDNVNFRVPLHVNGSNKLSKITLQGYITVPDNDLASVQAELPQHVKLTQKEDGCLIFRVSQDAENQNVFNVYEAFVNRVAFEKHQQRVRNSRWGKIAENVKRHYQISEGS